MKSLSPSELSPIELQAMLQAAVAPRPIALASTIDQNGNVNLSPFSFFNIFSSNPPVLIFSPARRVRDNTTKDTLRNVSEVPEVVIASVNFDMVQQTSLSSTEYETGVDEFVKSGFTKMPATLVRPPLVAESPVNMECKVLEIKPLGNQGGAGNLVICEIVKLHVRKKYLNEKEQIDQKKIDLVSRLGGNWYGRTNADALFEVPKPIATKGIGFDLLPKQIAFSKIFTGNNLGMLANVEHLDGLEFSAEENIHRIAQKLLSENKVEEAWKILRK